MTTTFVSCEHLAKPEDITEIEHMFGGREYLCRVLLREGDKQWATFMTATAQSLGEVIFP